MARRRDQHGGRGRRTRSRSADQRRDAQLRPEDLILAIDGTPIERVDDVQRLLASDAIGLRVAVEVVREGRRLQVDLVPDELEA